MKKLRIALWNNLPGGGGKRALFEMASGLVRKGHHLESWCPPTAHRDYLPLDRLMPEHVVPYERSMPPRWRMALPGRFGFGKQAAAMDRHTRACALAINAGGFDVLLSGNCSDYAVTPIGCHVAIPKVLYCQEPYRVRHEARFGEESPRPAPPPPASPLRASRGWAGRVLADYWKNRAIADERAAAAAFDLILANSAFSRESILRCYGLDSRVCYLGINTDLFRRPPAPPPRERFVLGLGTLHSHKDIATALAAIAGIPAGRRPPLVWIGNAAKDHYLEKMRALAASLAVDFTPLTLVTDAVLVDRLSRASVLLYTSRMEPFGFAPLEANACGTPVVAIAEGGVRETVRHGFNGLTVPDRDPAALTRALLQLLDDPALARRLGENGCDHVRSAWTWEACVDRLEASLLEVSARRS